MGHSITIQLDNSYLIPTVDRLFEEFVTVIPDLTVDDSARKEIELEKVLKENLELEKNNEENKLVKNELTRQGIVLENVMKELNEFKNKKFLFE